MLIVIYSVAIVIAPVATETNPYPSELTAIIPDCDGSNCPDKYTVTVSKSMIEFNC